ncbi:hypothetical protein [Fructobacillus fructosus]|uniref:hypothetical protein n=1 Tax=Fructobacillus fructosus TaxID=1631 RepID=UPI002D9B758E|nr:unnamed protein product [Fructobacillus fructosus]CAK1250921.1 unnamed protein product [Fructobacillus fructosus]CAK1252367.1 unnamed protein product [Fructobacillus fructosus]
MSSNLKGTEDLIQALKNFPDRVIEEEAKKHVFEINCGKCGKSFKSQSGEHECPHCGAINNINVEIKIES